MTAQTQASAVGKTAVSSKSAPLVTQLIPVFAIARTAAVQPPHRSAILFPSPPLAPPLVLRV